MNPNEGTLSRKDKFVLHWLTQKKWIEALENRIQEYMQQNSSSLPFLEWLFGKDLLTPSQFGEAIQERHQIVEWECLSCQKVFLGKWAALPPKCQECRQPLTSSQKKWKEDTFLGKELGGCILVRKLGQGGMGSVYLAFHSRLKKWVAIKLLPRTINGLKENEQERFLLEARAGSQLEHPNIIAVLDVGEDQNCYYMVQQYIEGESLRDKIERQGSLSIAEILPILRGICAGLGYAHQNRIVHRDIKPDNIMLTPENETKIADFGLAKSLDAIHSISMTGMILGTPHFMSPEQCEGMKNLDHRTDIYSLGATLFQMVTGKLPYEAPEGEERSAMKILYQQIHDPVPNPAKVKPDLDPMFGQMIIRCLAKKPEERFQSCLELIEHLQLYEQGGLKTSHFPTLHLSKVTLPTLATFVKMIPPKKRLKKVGFVLGILLLSFILFHGLRTREKKPVSLPQETISEIEQLTQQFLNASLPEKFKDIFLLLETWEKIGQIDPTYQEQEALQKKLISFRKHLEELGEKSLQKLRERKTDLVYIKERFEQIEDLDKKLKVLALPFSEEMQQKLNYLRWENQIIQLLIDPEIPSFQKEYRYKIFIDKKPLNPTKEKFPEEIEQKIKELQAQGIRAELESKMLNCCLYGNFDLATEVLYELYPNLTTENFSKEIKTQIQTAIQKNIKEFEKYIIKGIRQKKTAEILFFLEILWEIQPAWPTTRPLQKIIYEFFNLKTQDYSLQGLEGRLKVSQQLLEKYVNANKHETSLAFQNYKNHQQNLINTFKQILQQSSSAKVSEELLQETLKCLYPDFTLISECLFFDRLQSNCFQLQNGEFVQTTSYQKIVLFREIFQQSQSLMETFQKNVHQSKARMEISIQAPLWESQISWYNRVFKGLETQHLRFFMLEPEYLKEYFGESILQDQTLLYQLLCFAILRGKSKWSDEHIQYLNESPQKQKLSKLLSK